MGKFNKFMKGNKIAMENTTYPATKSLLDENGEPLLWTIKPLTSKDNDKLLDKCSYEVPITGKPGMYRTTVDNIKYATAILCECVLEPDLNDAELQDSYGVKTPEALIKELVDDPKEYQDFVNFVQGYPGTEDLAEKVEEAKN